MINIKDITSKLRCLSFVRWTMQSIATPTIVIKPFIARIDNYTLTVWCVTCIEWKHGLYQIIVNYRFVLCDRFPAYRRRSWGWYEELFLRLWWIKTRFIRTVVQSRYLQNTSRKIWQHHHHLQQLAKVQSVKQYPVASKHENLTFAVPCFNLVNWTNWNYSNLVL